MGHGEADDEVGVDEMVRGRFLLKWGEPPRRDAQLPMAPGTADEPDILAQTDARDLARDERRRDPQPRGEEMRLLGIGDERREQLTLWERLRRAVRGDGLCAERGRSQGAEPERDEIGRASGRGREESSV